jgi:MFS transporter, DHA3 family, macrolide efflux protein
MSIDLVDSSYLVMGPAALGMVLGALFVGLWGMKFLKGSLIYAGLFVVGIILIFLSMVGKVFYGLPLTLSFLFVFGFSNSMITVPSSTILQQDSKGSLRGRVYGVLTSLTGGVSLIPVMFSGIMADIMGVGTALLIIGVLVFGISLYEGWKRNMI